MKPRQKKRCMKKNKKKKKIRNKIKHSKKCSITARRTVGDRTIVRKKKKKQSWTEVEEMEEIQRN